VLNVEGDAFGAGLLQNFVDRTAKREAAAAELTEVRLEGGAAAADPEHSPLIEKPAESDGGKKSQSGETESAM